MPKYPIRITVTGPENGINLTGGFSLATGLAATPPKPEQRFTQTDRGHDLTLRRGVLRGEGFDRWLHIMRVGGSVTAVALTIEQDSAAGVIRFRAPEAWLDTAVAPAARAGGPDVTVDELRLACSALQPD
jgi:hypothetical protein